MANKPRKLKRYAHIFTFGEAARLSPLMRGSHNAEETYQDRLKQDLFTSKDGGLLNGEAFL